MRGSMSERLFVARGRRRVAVNAVVRVGDDDVVGERLVDTALSRRLVVTQLRLTETAQELLRAREVRQHVLRDDEVGAVEDGDETGVGNEGVVLREDANRLEDGVGVGGHVLQSEARWGIESVEVE